MEKRLKLLATKKIKDVKPDLLIDDLYSVYEQNYNILYSLLSKPLAKHTGSYFNKEKTIELMLTSTLGHRDIQINMNTLSSYTVDIEMHYREDYSKKINYIFNLRARLFLDAKILEVRRVDLNINSLHRNDNSTMLKIDDSKPENSIQSNLTKILIVNKWFKKLVIDRYNLK